MYCLSCLLNEKFWYSVVIADIGRRLGNFIGTGYYLFKGYEFIKNRAFNVSGYLTNRFYFCVHLY